MMMANPQTLNGGENGNGPEKETAPGDQVDADAPGGQVDAAAPGCQLDADAPGGQLDADAPDFVFVIYNEQLLELSPDQNLQSDNNYNVPNLDKLVAIHLTMQNRIQEINPELLEYEVVEIARKCSVSPLNEDNVPRTGIHVKSGDGLLRMRISVGNNVNCGNLGVIAYLRRSIEPFCKIPVDVVCAKHRDPAKSESQVLESNALSAVYYPATEGHFPGVFERLNDDNILEYKFACNDSDQTWTGEEKLKERARDMDLVLNLFDTLNPTQIIARRMIDVWPKASVNKRDLDKLNRREEKGGAAEARGDQTELTDEDSHLIGKTLSKYNCSVGKMLILVKQVLEKKVIKTKTEFPKGRGIKRPLKIQKERILKKPKFAKSGARKISTMPKTKPVKKVEVVSETVNQPESEEYQIEEALKQMGSNESVDAVCQFEEALYQCESNESVDAVGQFKSKQFEDAFYQCESEYTVNQIVSEESENKPNAFIGSPLSDIDTDQAPSEYITEKRDPVFDLLLNEDAMISA